MRKWNKRYNNKSSQQKWMKFESKSSVTEKCIWFLSLSMCLFFSFFLSCSLSICCIVHKLSLSIGILLLNWLAWRSDVYIMWMLRLVGCVFAHFSLLFTFNDRFNTKCYQCQLFTEDSPYCSYAPRTKSCVYERKS